jgi:dipeptidyl aminopeptidase/acylaminoacyl peptidase
MEAGVTSQAFSDRSAIQYSDRIEAETLLLHGKYDDRASVDQAEQFSRVLAQAGVSVSLHTLEGGHRLPRDQVTPILRDFLTRIFRPAVTLH